jgi:hypothetical protein
MEGKMLLKDYRLEIFKSKCQPGAMGVHCHAYFGQDVSRVLPYLAMEGGGEPKTARSWSLQAWKNWQLTSQVFVLTEKPKAVTLISEEADHEPETENTFFMHRQLLPQSDGRRMGPGAEDR